MKLNTYLFIAAIISVSGCKQDTSKTTLDNSKNNQPKNVQQWSGKPTLKQLETAPTPHQAMNQGLNKNMLTNKKEIKGIKKASGGHTIFELYSSKGKLDNTKIKVRGKVVKFSSNIMKRNWIHIQDGSGSNESFDLTVTSTQQTKIGATILVDGIIRYDKDFGAGYKYKVIIEEAKLTEE